MSITLSRAEDLVVAFASFMRPKVYVEIGTYLGNTFRQVAAIPGVTAYGCDAEAVFLEGLIPPTATFAHCMSSKFIREIGLALGPGSVNLAFVDGSHEAEIAWDDINELLVLMAPDGLIFVHDAYPQTKEMTGPRPADTGKAWSGDVYRAVARFAQLAGGKFDFEVIRLAPFNMALIRKGRRNAPWE